MFIQMLSQRQQAIFLALAHKMAHVDGVYAPEEKNRIQALREQMAGIEPDEIQLAELASIFTTKQTKVAMLIELASIAMADESIADEENTLLREISKALAIDPGELDEIVSWVSRAFYLFREVQSFMEE